MSDKASLTHRLENENSSSKEKSLISESLFLICYYTLRVTMFYGWTETWGRSGLWEPREKKVGHVGWKLKSPEKSLFRVDTRIIYLDTLY